MTEPNSRYIYILSQKVLATVMVLAFIGMAVLVTLINHLRLIIVQKYRELRNT